MLRSDEENLILADTITAVDRTNASFYARFPYPWAPAKFEFLTDRRLEGRLLNQSLGDFDNTMVPPNPEVWVAGCGTNQAVYTALRFPEGRVIGSDLSSTSLEICADTASRLGISNLELRQESINEVDYRDRFDLVISTGVIHHNSDPAVPLARLAVAAKPTGVLELMVYNRFHRILPSTFQKAMRILGGDNPAAVDFETELSLTQRLIDSFPLKNLIGGLLRQNKGAPESMLADVLLQPVERSYTVESFEELTMRCGLELLAPCINRFDQASDRYLWHIEFGDPEIQRIYEALPDNRRWHVSNLLLFEQSPMMWFYLQRRESGRPRRSEREVCDEFLDRAFVPAGASRRTYLRMPDDSYALLPETSESAPPSDEATCRVLAAASGTRSMREAFQRAGVPLSFGTVNAVRLRTTTAAFPHLVAAPAMTAAQESEAGELRNRANLEKLRRSAPKPIEIAE